MAYYPWQPQYWVQGNFNWVDSFADDRLYVSYAFTMTDSGRQSERDGSHPLFYDSNVAAERLTVAGFNAPSEAGASVWDDSGPNHLEVHFSSQAISEAYATALAAAATPDDVAAVVKNYRDHAVGGYWGTLGVVPS